MSKDRVQNNTRGFLRHRLQQIFIWFTPNNIASLLIIVGVLFLIPLPFVEKRFLPPFLDNFFVKISPELVGIGIGVILIGSANKRIADQQEIKSLILQMRESSNEFAIHALIQLRDKKWLLDDSLNGESLWRANLKKAELWDAKLRGVNFGSAILEEANLCNANLDGAVLHDANLSKAILHKTILTNTEIYNCNLENADFYGVDLRGARFLGTFRGYVMDSPHVFLYVLRRLECATMPNGLRYDGRYCLPGDLIQASANYNVNNTAQMAEFYQITHDEYLEGQEWANANLPILWGG